MLKTMNDKLSDCGDLNRRRFLQKTAGAVGIAMLASPLSAFADEDSQKAFKAFMQVSSTLTQRQSLDLALGQRFFAELQHDDNAFADAVISLATNLPKEPTADLENSLSADQRDTAKKIVSAWYTGIVGKGRSARVVTYRHALEFETVDDVLVVRTYCPNKPGFWAAKPVERKA